MAETVVKQLQFTPFTSTPPHQQLGNLTQLQQRLDSRPEWAAGSSNGEAAAGRHRAGIFKVPSDDEDDDVMADGGFNEHVEQQQQQLFTYAYDSSSISAMQAQQQQQQQQQPGPMFEFSAMPSSQQSPVEAVLWEHTRALAAHALRAAGSKQQQLHSQLSQVEQQLVVQLQEVQQQVAHKRARAAAADEASARQRMLERQRRLQEVQQQQAALQAAHASALQEARKQQAEAEAKRKAAAEAAAAAAAAAERQRQEAERKKQQQEEAAKAAAAAAAKAAAEAKAQQQAPAAVTTSQQQQQQPAAAAAAGSSAQPAASSSAADQYLVRATPGALAHECQLKAVLDAAESAAAALTSRPELKAARRSVEKKVTMWVSQISGTQQQIRDKSQQLIELITSCSSEEERSLACITLANRMLSQCEAQVARINSFAFPLAYVCVAVGAAHPRFMEVLLAKLQQACPLLVPKHVKRTPGASDADYFKGLGYKIIDDPKQEGVKRLETADEYVARSSAMVLLFASIVQTESAGNPLPLAHGWAWMARCLNSMPANRSCAAAMIAFLSHAGYRMSAVYGRQFIKLLQNLDTYYLKALEGKAQSDANLRAVATRLQTYIQGRVYLKEPEGRTLKRVDDSATIHA